MSRRGMWPHHRLVYLEVAPCPTRVLSRDPGSQSPLASRSDNCQRRELCVRSETEAAEAVGRADPQGQMHLIPSWAKAPPPPLPFTGGACGERCCRRGFRHRTDVSFQEYKFIHTEYVSYLPDGPTTPSAYKHSANLSHPSTCINVIRTNSSRSSQVLFPPFSILTLACRGTPFPWGRDSGVWRSAMSRRTSLASP